MSQNLSNLKVVIDQLAASPNFQNQEILCGFDTTSGTERYAVSNSDPPDYNEPEVQVDVTNAALIIKEGVTL